MAIIALHPGYHSQTSYTIKLFIHKQVDPACKGSRWTVRVSPTWHEDIPARTDACWHGLHLWIDHHVQTGVYLFARWAAVGVVLLPGCTAPGARGKVKHFAAAAKCSCHDQGASGSLVSPYLQGVWETCDAWQAVRCTHAGGAPEIRVPSDGRTSCSDRSPSRRMLPSLIATRRPAGCAAPHAVARCACSAAAARHMHVGPNTVAMQRMQERQHTVDSSVLIYTVVCKSSCQKYHSPQCSSDSS